MSNREKIILALMAAALLYGAYHFLGPSQGGSKGEQSANLEALNAYVLGVAASMSQLALNEAQKYVIASAAARWSEDPFLRVRPQDKREASPQEAATSTETLNVTYSGYAEMNGSRIAIINGREYSPGEELEISGFVVRRIDPAKVELEKVGSGQTISIPLQDMFTGQETRPQPGKKR